MNIFKDVIKLSKMNITKENSNFRSRHVTLADGNRNPTTEEKLRR